jgi:hypothetical protein
VAAVQEGNSTTTSTPSPRDDDDDDDDVSIDAQDVMTDERTMVVTTCATSS